MNLKDKSSLRQQWKTNLIRYHSSFSLWNQEICGHLLADSSFQKAETIALYYPRDWEVNLLPLWQKRPNHCAFPKTDPQSLEIDFYLVKSLSPSNFSKGMGNIPEPIPKISRIVTDFKSTDLILVPGFVFDNKGGRIGSGKGVYDRFLAKEGKLAQKLGIAFSPQVVSESIPQEPHDITLNGLVTEKGFIYF